MTRRLDLAVIIPTLDKYGGAERVAIECIARWQDKHDVTLYATSIDDALLKEHGIGASVRRVPLSRHFEGEHQLLLNATLLPHLWRGEIGQHEIYHAHLWPTHLIDLHPMVWYPHEPFRALHDLRYEANARGAETEAHIYPKYNYDRFADRFYTAYLEAISISDRGVQPDRVVANSQYTARYLAQVYGREVADVVYPGTTLPRVTGLPRDRNLFVTISQLWAHKRTRLLVEAVALTDEAQLLVIGSGPEAAALEEMAGRLGVGDRVFLMSGLKNWELELILARACAFLFAPIREPFGIVVLEAMAAGLPVIAVDEGGYVEACTTDTAFLIPPFPSAFADKIRTLRDDEALRVRMGQAGRERARLFSWSRTATELETILLAEADKSDRALASTSPADTLLVGTQYYLWYEEGYGAAHWNDDPATGYVSDPPLAGYYGSNKGETIVRHLALLSAIGVDFLILNLHIDERGANPAEWRAIRTLYSLANATKSPLRFAVQIAPYADDVETIAETIEHIGQEFGSDPHTLRLDGKPALFWFWSTALDGKEGTITALRSAASEFRNIACSLRLPRGRDEASLTGGLFSGFAPYSPLELADEASWESVWTMGYKAALDAGLPWRVAAVSPGYDDTALSDPRRVDNPYRFVDRRSGQTYQRGFDWLGSLTPRPHLAIVSTFNELHENTHIEPSLRHGTRYIDLTRDGIAQLKRQEE